MGCELVNVGDCGGGVRWTDLGFFGGGWWFGLSGFVRRAVMGDFCLRTVLWVRFFSS